MKNLSYDDRVTLSAFLLGAIVATGLSACVGYVLWRVWLRC